MAAYAQTEEEDYIEKVKRQADEQADENIPTLQEIQEERVRERERDQSRLKFSYGLLILIVVLVFVSKGMPLLRSCLGEGEN